MNYQNRYAFSRFSIRGLVLLACLALALPVMAGWTQQQKITSTPRGVGAQHGNAVAISGNTMVVGARHDSTTASQAGAAFVYVLNGGTWTQQAVLLASDGAAIDKFGHSVAISEDTIVVGSYNDDSPLSNGGSAYVFVRNGTTWTEQQKLTASDGTADDEFGNAVGIEAEFIVVGSHFADLPGTSSAGSVYLYRRTGTTWTQVQKLASTAGPFGVIGQYFGESVAVSGGKIAVGARGDNIPETAAGAVYVFSDGGGGTYVLQQKLNISGGTNGDNFGGSVALEGNTLVGGAREDTPFLGQTARGSAYVFEFDGAAWVSQGRLLADDGAAFDRFGWSVAVSSNVIAVGAREDDAVVGPDAGSAYLFKRAGATWTQRQKLTPSDPFNGDRFGASVALSLGNLVIGASEKALSAPNGQGAVYYYAVEAPCRSMDFSTATNFDSGSYPNFVAVGDFNLDGKPDLATANQGSANISVLQGNGAGSFGAATNFSVGDFPYSIAVGDFNLDGKPDLATANSGPNNISVLLGNGAGSFGAAVNFSLGDEPWNVAVGDFNLDGKPDFATANFHSSTVSVLLGNGAGSFGTAVNFNVELFPYSVAVGDFNLDGKPDLATANNLSRLSVLLGNGAGSFGTATDFHLGTSPHFVAVGDFNLDGKPDLATANYNDDNSSVLLGDGAGSFGAPTNFSVGDSPNSVVVGDLDLDDKPDLATANRNSNNVSVLLGNGAGSFAAAANFSVGTYPYSVAVGDFNLDGKPDLAAANAVSNDVSVLLNTCVQSPTSVSVGGRVLTSSGRGISKARISITDPNGETRTVLTSSFGYFRFDAVEAGQTYTISVQNRRYQFANRTQVVFVGDTITGMTFTAVP